MIKTIVDYIGIHSWADLAEFAKNIAGIVLWTAMVILPSVGSYILILIIK